MSMANNARKYGDKAVIEPVRVIQERKKIGLHPSCPVPSGAILCYDTAFWQWVCAGTGYVECDGWLAGSYLVPCSDSWILVLKVPGFGAPAAVMTLEELAAFGIKKFVNLGTAGGLQQNLNAGDIVVCDRAIRDSQRTCVRRSSEETFSIAKAPVGPLMHRIARPLINCANIAPTVLPR
jgi:hypothetical protein